MSLKKTNNIIVLYFGGPRRRRQNLAPATEDATFTFERALPDEQQQVSFNFGGTSFILYYRKYKAKTKTTANTGVCMPSRLILQSKH
jgi:hypothetical protein